MLAHIKELERSGQWDELHRLAETLPPGDALARVHLALSSYYEDAAASGQEYRIALHHARRATETADRGSLIHVWSFSKLANYSADLGLFREAEQAARTYRNALPGQPGARANIGVVHFAQARVRHYRRQFKQAIPYWRQTEAEAPTVELAERARMNLVWTLAMAGDPTEAYAALPANLVATPIGFLDAAKAAIYAALGDWNSARGHALVALASRAAGEWRTYDLLQAAELYLILKTAALHQGQAGQGAAWLVHSAALLAGWNADLFACLLRMFPGEGGDFFHAAASHRGPGGYKRTGLRGTVG